MIETRGIVLEMGEEVILAWNEIPRCSIGDKVMISKYAGIIVTGPRDKKKYRMVNALDVFCTIDDGVETILESMFESHAKDQQAELANQVRRQQGVSNRRVHP